MTELNGGNWARSGMADRDRLPPARFQERKLGKLTFDEPMSPSADADKTVVPDVASARQDQSFVHETAVAAERRLTISEP
jgi:hypothetical protein